MKPILLCTALLLTFGMAAQKIKRESVSFEYESMPSTPFSEEVTSYSVFVSQTFKDGFEESIMQWEADCAQAQAQYDQEMADYNAKSTGAKILEKTLLDEGKPKLMLPPKPQMDQKIFEESLLASKIDMNGLSRGAGGAEVTIELMGYESTPSELKDKQYEKKDGTKYKEYWRVMNYRHVVRFSVKQPNGEVVMDEVLTSSETYSTETSKKYRSMSDLNKAWRETSVNTRLQSSIIDQHMNAINSILNDHFCFYPKNYNWTIFHAKTNKKQDYTDLTDMAFEVKYAMEDFYNKQDEAKVQLEKAIMLWESTLEEADFDDNKARVTRKMAGYLYLNLIHANIWLRNFDRVDRLYDDMRRADVKNSAESSGEALDKFCEDQKARYEANFGE